MHEAFFNVDKLEVDSLTLQKIKETEVLFQQLHEAELALTQRVQSLSIEAQKVTEAEQKLKELADKTEALVRKTEESTRTLKENTETLKDIQANIKTKQQELKQYRLTQDDVLQLELKKQDLLAFLQQHNLTAGEKDELVTTVSNLRQAVRDLETKKSDLIKEILEKEAVSRKLESDLERPLKILEEAKALNLSAESTYEAVKEQVASQPEGSAGSYMRKVKARYPDIDLTNMV